MKRSVFGFLAAFALAAVALAADSTGAWSGTFSLGDGGDSRSAYMVLRQTGAKLTGTAGPNSGEQWPIQNAKIEGNKISFEVRDTDGNLFKVALTPDGGNLKGDLTAEMSAETLKGKIAFSRVK